METIYTDSCISITELKKNPMAILREAGDEPVAILNHNKPAAYLVPAHIYEQILEQLDDIKLVKIVREREGEKTVKVNLDEI